MKRSDLIFWGGLTTWAVALAVLLALFVFKVSPAEGGYNPYYPTANSGPATWSDASGTTGLTVKYVQCDSTTGTPPSVTINGGVAGYVLNDVGGGQYWRIVPQACYHIYVGGVWKQQTYVAGDIAIRENDDQDSSNWVTSGRLADNSVGSAEIQSGSVLGSDIGDGQISASDFASGAVPWGALSTNVKGSSPDTAFNIDKMQDTLRAIATGWTAGDFTVAQMSDTVKHLLGTSFSSAGCSLTVVGAFDGVRAQVTMTSVPNYDAVYKYEFFVGDVAYAHSPGVLDSLGYATLIATMNLRQSIYSPGRGPRSVLLSWPEDTCFVVAVATDYAGTHTSSGPKSGIADLISPGFVTELLANPYYVNGQSLAQLVNSIGAATATAASAVSTAVRAPVLWHGASTVAATGYDQNAGAIVVHRSSEIEASSKDQIRLYREKVAGYNRATATMMARCERIGDKGYIELSVGGLKNQVTVGGAGVAADTVTQVYSVAVNIGTLTDGTLYEVLLGCWTGVDNDTVLYWGENIKIE